MARSCFRNIPVAILFALLLKVVSASAASDLESGITELAQQISKNMVETGKKKIAVVEFSNLDGVITAFGQHLAEELITELFLISPGQFEVVERRQLMKVLSEQKLTMSGLLDAKAMESVGKILGIEAIVTGSITDLENNVKVNARMIGVKTARIFAVARTSIPKIGIVAKLMEKEVVSAQPMGQSTSLPTSQGRQVVSKKAAASRKDWKVTLKRKVGEFGDRFKIFLEYVEKKENNLVVGIGFRNLTKDIQRIQLDYRYAQTTALLDDDEGSEYNLKKVKGLTRDWMGVNPGAKKLAIFTFPFPEGVKRARFVSQWHIYRGGDVPLSIPFTIPPTKK